jgi:hypothetical protein
MISSMLKVIPQDERLRSILRADYDRNQLGRGYTLDEYLNAFDRYVHEGGLFFETPRVLYFYRQPADLNVEFHCVNGGKRSDLGEGLNKFLDYAFNHFETAYTYYDNPKNSEWLKEYVKYPMTISQVNLGADRTFMAVIKLRAA